MIAQSTERRFVACGIIFVRGVVLPFSNAQGGGPLLRTFTCLRRSSTTRAKSFRLNQNRLIVTCMPSDTHFKSWVSIYQPFPREKNFGEGVDIVFPTNRSGPCFGLSYSPLDEMIVIVANIEVLSPLACRRNPKHFNWSIASVSGVFIYVRNEFYRPMYDFSRQRIHNTELCIEA